MTEVAYYDLHILLCHYNSIAKNLTQGATEVTISRVKMTQIFLQCGCLNGEYTNILRVETQDDVVPRGVLDRAHDMSTG